MSRYNILALWTNIFLVFDCSDDFDDSRRFAILDACVAYSAWRFHVSGIALPPIDGIGISRTDCRNFRHQVVAIRVFEIGNSYAALAQIVAAQVVHDRITWSALLQRL